MVVESMVSAVDLEASVWRRICLFFSLFSGKVVTVVHSCVYMFLYMYTYIHMHIYIYTYMNIKGVFFMYMWKVLSKPISLLSPFHQKKIKIFPLDTKAKKKTTNICLSCKLNQINFEINFIVVHWIAQRKKVTFLLLMSSRLQKRYVS